MLNLFSKKPKPAEQLDHTTTSALFQELLNRMDLRFNELSAQIREVELSVKELEVKLLTKDLKDKQQMGALHYKLHERANPRNDAAIEGVELELSLKKRLAREQ